MEGRRVDSTAPISFHFLPAEVAEMEEIVRQLIDSIYPRRHVIYELAGKFTASRAGVAGRVVIKPKQVRTWFQNHYYGPRRKEAMETRRFAANKHQASSSSVAPRAQARTISGSKRMAKGQFVGGKMLTGAYVRRNSIPFQPTECVDVRCYNFLLCYQEHNEELPFNSDALVHAIDRRRHGYSESSCKFLVRYEHDGTEEIVPLSKLRPKVVYTHGLPEGSGVATRCTEAAPVIIEVDDD